MRNNKKLIVIIIAVVAAIVALALAVGGLIYFLLGNGECKHTWLEATCSAPKTCSVCKAVEGEPLAHQGGTATCVNRAVCSICNAEYGTLASHDFEDATCEEAKHCKNCSVVEGEALGHTSGTPTCTGQAICSRCGEGYGELGLHIYNQDEVKAEALKSAATCTSAAVYYKSCSCGAISTNEDEVFVSGAFLDHTYEEISSTEADCEHEATKTYLCSCGDEYIDVVAPALNHDISGVTPVEKAVNGSSCEFVLVYVCKREGCGAEVEGENIARHTYIASITTEATCAHDGLKTYTCACGDSYTEVIPKNASSHNWVKGSVEGGVRTDSCSECGATKSVTVYEGNNTGSTNTNDLKDKEIEINDANINLGSDVLDAIGDKDITISADKLDGDDKLSLGLSDEQLAQVGDNPVYNFTINDGTENISQFGENNYVTITLPYTLKDGDDVDSIAVWFINDEGQLESIKATYSNGYVTFQTNHFSYYTVTRLTPEERCALYGHSYTEKVQEATCTKGGYTMYFCVRCHDQYKENETEATGHKYSETVTAATCTKAGNVVHTCDVCKYTYKTRVPALGHSYVEVENIPPTCTANGYVKYECSACKHSYQDVVNKLAHEMVSEIISATCESNGYTLHKCANCEYNYRDTYVAPLGHTYVADGWKWTQTYTSASLTFVCANDSTHMEFVTATITVETVLSDCTDLYKKCTYTATVTFEGQTYTDVKVTEEGTLDHVFGDEWKYDDKEHWHECACGAKEDIASHTYENETVTKPNTCTENGESTAYCSCGATSVTVLEATGHDFVESGREEPTCAKEGYVEYKCQNCGEIKREALAKPDHVYTSNVVAPTCTEKGYTEYTCSCGDSYRDSETDATGHNYTSVVTAPTCVDKGYTTYTCACGDTYVDDEVDALGHIESDWIIDREETSTEEGSKHTECTVCGEVLKTEVIPAYEGLEFALGEDGKSYYVSGIGSYKSLDVVIPAEHKGLPVTAIGESAFANNKEITSVTIPSSVTVIGENAFKNCDGLTSVTLTRGVVTIGDKAFFACKELKAITIPNTVTSIGEMAFSNCGMLELITYVGTEAQWEAVEKGKDWDKGAGKHVIDCTLEMHQHEYSATVTAPTCVDKGYTTYTCSCGDTYVGDEVAPLGHNYSATVTAPTCVDKGYTTYICSCGDTYVGDEVAPLGHNYSATVTAPTCVDKGYTTYTCDCGDTYVGDEVEPLGHNYSAVVTAPTCVDKGYTTYTCSCGDTYVGDEVDVTDNHTYVDGVCSLCQAVQTCDHTALHEETINFADHGSCDWSITFETCDCGEVKNLLTDLDYTGCDLEESNEEYVEDENGEIISASMTVTCVKCGLYANIIANVERDGCHYEVIYNIEFANGEDVIVDGIIWNAYSYDEHEYEMITIDLSEYDGCCGGTITLRKCTDCGLVESVYGFNPECDIDYSIDEEEVVDEDGVVHYMGTYTCSQCEFKYIYESWEVNHSVCEYTTNTNVTIFYGDQIITEVSHSYSGNNHEWQYNYELLGATCEDGVKVTQYCAKCESEQTYTQRSHIDIEYKHINLSEYTSCGGVANVRMCNFCNHIDQIENINFNCKFGDGVVEDILDDNGVVCGYRGTRTCENCGIVYIYEEYEESISVCEYYTHINHYVYVNDELVLSSNRENYGNNHQYEYVYEFEEGATCESGRYKVIETCTVCGESDSWYSSGHRYDYKYTYLEEYGLCGGYIYAQVCDVCDKAWSEASYNSYCKWQYFADTEDGYRISFCSDCGVYLYHKREISERDENCVYRIIQSWIFYKDSVEIFRFENAYEYETHNYEFRYELPLGGTCDDGYLRIGTCIDCGYVTESRYHGHQTQWTNIYLSEYGACGGYVECYVCQVCGAISSFSGGNYECLFEVTTEDIFDDDGIKIGTLTTKVCPDCGLTVVQESIREFDENCYLIVHVDSTISINGEEIFTSSNRYNYGEAHQFETVYENLGDTCEDGVKVIQTCQQCGYYYEYVTYSHSTTYETIYFSDYGMCGGYVEIGTCQICEEIVNTYQSYYCSWYHVSNTDDGHEVYECYYCNAQREQYSVIGEKDENCQYITTYYYIISINCEEVVRYSSASRSSAHNYEYEFIMDGNYCTDGYTVITTCTDCDYRYESEKIYYHSGYEIFILDVTAYDCCDNHYIRVYSCPCGYDFYYDTQTNPSSCSDCGLSVYSTYEDVYDGCTRDYVETIIVTLGDEELFNRTVSVRYIDHNYSNVNFEMVDGGFALTSTCTKCGDVKSIETQSAELVDDGSGYYYYDFEFTPDETATYIIGSMTDGDTYVDLYKMVDGKLVNVSYNDDGGNNNNFYLSYKLEAGTTYVYRIRFCNSAKSGTIVFYFNSINSAALCNHGSSTGFTVLKEGAETCEDGVICGSICKYCGRFNGIYETTYHHVVTKDYVDLQSHGACYGYYNFYSCACGYEHGFNRDLCYDSYNTTYEYDADGNYITTETRSCSTCGLNYVRRYYTVKDHDNCKMVYHYSVSITINGEVILESNYEATRSNSHDYRPSFEMYGSVCTDGYKVIYTCADCGDSYEGGEYYSHNTYTVFTLDPLAEECCYDHTVYVYSCPCGYDFSYMCSNFDWNSEINGYSCSDCGLSISNTYENVEDGCTRDYVETIIVTLGDEELYNNSVTVRYVNHNYAEVDFEMVDDGFALTRTCTKCGEVKSLETQKAELVDDGNGYYYYDFEFTPDETSTYVISSMTDGDTYVILYKMVDGELVSLTYNDDGGNNNNFYLSYKLEAGTTYIYRIRFCSQDKSGEIVFYHTYANGSTLCSHNSSTGFTELKEGSETCEDGAIYGSICTYCGKLNSIYEITYHNTVTKDYVDLQSLGACYGYYSFYSCACGYEHGFNRSLCYDSSYTTYEYDEYGNYIRTETRSCSTCGLNYVRRYYTVKDHDNCKMVYYYSVSITINGEEVFQKDYEITKSHHDYFANFEMYGESCYDGYKVIYICADCGDSYEGGEYYSHNTYTVFTLDSLAIGCCYDHSLSVSTCPCGYALGYNSNNFSYDSANGCYYCPDCDISYEWVDENTTEGCYLTNNRSIVIYNGTEELYSKYATTSFANHRFEDTSVEIIDGIYNINVICTECGETRWHGSENVEFELQENGEYYYEYEVTIDSTNTYIFRTLATSYLYVDLYRVVDGEREYITGHSSWNGNVSFSSILHEGETYVYRITSGEDKVAEFFFSEYRYDSLECYHNYDVYFSCLLEGSTSCIDGTFYGRVCRDCGRLEYVSYNYSHDRVIQEAINLADYGACRGTYKYYACACGENESVELYDYCTYTYTSNRFYDEEGRLIYVETRTCSTCGLRYDVSYYTVKNRDNCTLTYYYTVSLTINGELIVEEEYTRTETGSHDYESVGILDEGATSCTEGVTIITTCKDCGYSYSNHYTYHATYKKETIDLEQYGAVCTGYATLYGCACGNTSSMSVNLLCDMDSNHTYNSNADAIQVGYNPSTHGYYHYFDNYGYIYTCAVTDPEQCAFSYRYLNYWVKDENACKAYHYKTYQFGYDATTDTCLYEITFKTGSEAPYHNYNVTSTNGSTHYDCPDCGSYYYEDYYYMTNSSGYGNYTQKHEIKALNTLDNGYNKYYEFVEEYDFDANDTHYMCRSYTKYIYSDDGVYESESTYSRYTGTFGDPGYEQKTTTNDRGKVTSSHRAYVYLKGYDYTIFEEYTEGDYWYRYDYTYNFIQGVGCFRTTVYTNSNGDNTTNSDEDYCRIHYVNTTLEPTCTQDGSYYNYCIICDRHTEDYVHNPYGHSWSYITDDWYYCTRCGLENINGADGSIVMSDLTAEYGNGENYVVGYWNKNSVEFTQYVCIILKDGTEIILEDIEYSEIEGLRAVVFSKADVEAAATELGYSSDEYLVKFVFVPYGADSSFDYAITFTEPVEYDGSAITGEASFKQYLSYYGGSATFTITPEEDSVWTFTTFGNTYTTYGYLYDANGNCIASNSYGGAYPNFLISYTLNAGETYTLNVSMYYYGSGDVVVRMINRPVV